MKKNMEIKVYDITKQSTIMSDDACEIFELIKVDALSGHLPVKISFDGIDFVDYSFVETILRLLTTDDELKGVPDIEWSDIDTDIIDNIMARLIDNVN